LNELALSPEPTELVFKYCTTKASPHDRLLDISKHLLIITALIANSLKTIDVYA